MNSQTIDQISKVKSLSDIADQNKVNSESINSQSDKLMQMAEELNKEMQYFRV